MLLRLLVRDWNCSGSRNLLVALCVLVYRPPRVSCDKVGTVVNMNAGLLDYDRYAKESTAYLE